MRRTVAAMLPHEWAFGGFLAVTWLRLVGAQGPFGVEALLFLLGVACVVGIASWGASRDTATAWRVRLGFYPIAMNLYFQLLRTAVPAITPVRYDDALRAADRLVFADALSFLLAPHATPLLTEVFSIAYFLFFPYLLFSFVIYFAGDVARLRSFVGGLFTLYGIGFLGYTLVPAAGPYLAYEFATPLTGWTVTALNAATVRAGSIGVDVFPSLHVAVSGYLLGFDLVHKRWRFWAYLVPCALLWASTQYLRYHYFVDLVAAIPLTLFSLAVAHRIHRAEGARP